RQVGYPLSFRGQVREVHVLSRVSRQWVSRLPSLLRVPVSPVPRSRRYYEGATTSQPRINGRLFGSLPPPTGYPLGSCPASSLPEGRRSLPGQGSWSAGAPILRLLITWTRLGSLRSPGDPSRALLRSWTPVESACPRHGGHVDAAPAIRTTRASALVDFEANSRSFGTCSPTLRATIAVTRKAGFRLADWPLPRGSCRLLITMERFSPD